VDQVRIGTRGSTLARTQTGHVVDALRTLGDLEIETVHIRTDGDRLTGSLATLGGTGVFVTALRDALLDGRCDLAVHSLKDLPTGEAPGLTVAAIPPRVDARDALCTRDGRPLVALPDGARVGTGSPRRAAQLLAVRPDLVVVDLRGNVDTRLRRVADGGLDAVVLAAAGLERIGRLDATTVPLDPTVMVPAPGQGALAVECRADLDPGSALAQALRALDDLPTRLAVTAERALLATLEAGCSAPVGAYARVDGRRLALSATVVAADGSARIHRTASRSLPVEDGDDAPRQDGVALSRDDAIAAAHDLGADLAAALLDAGAARLMATRTERP